MKTPKPTASSLRRNSGWVITSSRSTSETIAPAMNAPRMTSRPELLGERGERRRTAGTRRGRGSARSCPAAGARSSRMRMDRSAPRVTTKTTAASANTLPSSTSVEPVPPSPEKKSDSRMIAPKSAIDAAAMISCPNVDAISPASLSTGTSTPSDVAHRMIATSSGVSTRPPAWRPSETSSAIPNESGEAEPGEPQHAARGAARTRSPGPRGRAGTRARSAR